MSIRIDLYTFNKKSNSTAQPTGLTPASYDCIMLDGCDVLQPMLKLQAGVTASITGKNYAYINDFGRYYYITRWWFDRGLWCCTLTVDALASWKTAIGNYTGYVLRSSAASDGSIKDTFYPTKANPVHVTKAINISWQDSLANGTYVVGIINGSGVGSVSYYVFTPAQFAAFCSAVYNNTNDWLNTVSITEIGEDLLKTLFNPFEYIVSCMWFPIAVPSTGSGNVDLGWWTVPATGSHLVADVVPLVSYTVTPDQHPQAATRGSYLNSGPYTSITLDFQPFGLIPLDASVICGHSFTLNLYVDYITGTACLHIVVNGDNNTKTIIYSGAAQVGVPIQVSGRQPSVGSMITGAASVMLDNIPQPQGVLGDITHVAGTMISELTGTSDIAGKAAGVLSSISTGLKRLSSTGSNGSRAQILDELYLSQDFLLLTDEDNAHFGRPLYQDRQLSAIPGYIQLGDADISFAGMASELDAVRTHLLRGFYYE